MLALLACMVIDSCAKPVSLSQKELQGMASLFAEDIKVHTSMGITVTGLHIDGVEYSSFLLQPQENQTLQKLRDFPAETLLICLPQSQAETKTCMTRELPS